jgi:hypothetical protein
MHSDLSGSAIGVVKGWLVLLLGMAMLAGGAANASGPTRPVNPVKLKRTLMKRGIGMGFKVKELDGTRVTGVLTAIDDDTFEIAARGTTQTVSIAYTQVSAVHNDGDGHGGAASTTGKVATGFAIGAGVVGVMVIALTMFALHGG